jgi:putative ABC transport system substrate-binding protein
MKRRDLIALLGGAAVARLLAARAQQTPIPFIAFFGIRAPGDDPHLLAAFLQGLKAAGYLEGKNVAIEYHFAEGDYARLPALAANIARHQLAAIVANGPAA